MKKKLLLLVFIISFYGVKAQTFTASIDTSRVSCTNNYNLSISSTTRLSNQKSLKIKNGYSTKFSDYNIWSTSDDYAVAFWFKNNITDSISILTNSDGFSMSGSDNRITLNQGEITLHSGSLQSSTITIDTGWNHIAMHVKKNSSVSRAIIYLNGAAIDSISGSSRMEEFSFGDVNLEQVAPYEFLIDDVVLLIGDNLQNTISDIYNNCNWSTSNSIVQRYYSFETKSINSASFVDQLSLSNWKRIAGINYSGDIVLSQSTNSCANSYDVLWTDGNTSLDRLVPSGNNYSAIIYNSSDTIVVSITIPSQNASVSGYVDLFPDTIISYGNSIDTVVDWFNWPPDTSVVYGAGYVYALPQNSFTDISSFSNQNASVNGDTVRFENSGVHKFYLSDWSSGNFCFEEESVFVEILDSINLVNRNDVCDTAAELYPVNEVNRGILRLKGQSLKCTDISSFQDLEEFSVSFSLYWKGGINQTLIKALGLLDIYSISNDSLTVTDYSDTLKFKFPLLQWNFLTVTSSASELSIWVNDSLVCTKTRVRNRSLNLATGFAIGRDVIYHPLSSTFGINGANYSTEFEGGLTEISFWDTSLDSTSVGENVFVLDLENPNLISSYDFDPWGQNPQDLSYHEKELYIYNYGLSGGYIYDFPEDRKILQSGHFYSSNLKLASSLSLPAGDDFSLLRTYGLDTIEVLIDSINANAPILYQPKPDYVANNNFACSTDTVEIYLRGSYDSVSVDQIMYSSVDTVLYVLPSSNNQNYIITGFKDSALCSFNIEIKRYQSAKNSTIWNDTIICGKSEVDFTIQNYQSVWINSVNIDSIRITSDTLLFTRVSDSTGCSRFDTLDVGIDDYIQLQSSDTICFNDSLMLGPINIDVNDNISWFVDGILLSRNNTTYASDSSKYWFELERLNGCRYQDTIDISFHDDVSNVFEIDSISGACGIDTVCTNTVFTIYTGTTVAGLITKYNWDVNNDGSVEYTSINATHSFSLTGLKTIRLSIESEFGCIDDTTLFLYVIGPPINDFSILDTLLCGSNNFSIFNTNTSIADSSYYELYSYLNGNKTLIQSWNLFPQALPELQPSYLGDTTYYMSSSLFNCCGVTTAIDSLIITTPVVADFTISTDSACGPLNLVLEFDSLVKGRIDSITINFGDGLDTTVLPVLMVNGGKYVPHWNQVTHFYNYEGTTDTTFYITLEVFGNCGDSILTKSLKVFSGPYYTGIDTIQVCQESNVFYFTPDIGQCANCDISFPSSSPGLDSVQLTINNDSLYTFSFENEQGCSDQQSIWFDYHLTPTINAISPQLTICNEDTIGIGFQTNGAINWISHSLVGTSVDVYPSATTKYYASAQSIAGCQSLVDTINVEVNQLPVITLQDSNYVCVGLMEDLIPQVTGNGGYQFSWDSGQNTKDISISDATVSYTLTVTDANQCVETHTVFNSIMDYTIDAGANDSICFGEAYDLIPYQGNYQNAEWTINNDSLIGSSLNFTVAPLLSTWYTLTTSNDSGCVKTDSVKIAVDSLSQLSYSIYGLDDLKIGDTLSFKNLNVEDFHNYQWMVNGTLTSAQGDSAYWVPVFEGTYTLTIEGRNSLSCPNSLDSIFNARDILPRDYERLIYPNPTQGLFSYNFYSESEQTITISIVNDSGRIIERLEMEAREGINTANFDISSSAAGKYYLLIDSESETLKALRPWVIKIQ